MTWADAMGLELVKVTADEVVLEMSITATHTQSAGIVHGGVYCGLVETAASAGAALVAQARGQAPPVGLENNTSFLKAASAGRLRVTARPLTRGRTTQVWQADVVDASGTLLATGRVRLLCREGAAP